MFAVLEFSDFLWILVIVAIFSGGSAAAYSVFKPSDAARIRRLEAKVDLILKHLGLEYKNPAAAGLSEEVKALADDPAQKASAIGLHRKQTGLSLLDCKRAVEAYMSGRD